MKITWNILLSNGSFKTFNGHIKHLASSIPSQKFWPTFWRFNFLNNDFFGICFNDRNFYLLRFLLKKRGSKWIFLILLWNIHDNWLTQNFDIYKRKFYAALSGLMMMGNFLGAYAPSFIMPRLWRWFLTRRVYIIKHGAQAPCRTNNISSPERAA